MLLLTATSETQGYNPGDFCDAIEGELAAIFADCHVPAHSDGLMHCREGCPQRFYGLNSHELSTTALVRDVPVTRDDYLTALSGYAETLGSPAPLAFACHIGSIMVDTATRYPLGTVLGFADGKLTARARPRFNLRDLVPRLARVGEAAGWRRHYARVIRSL